MECGQWEVLHVPPAYIPLPRPGAEGDCPRVIYSHPEAGSLRGLGLGGETEHTHVQGLWPSFGAWHNVCGGPRKLRAPGERNHGTVERRQHGNQGS